MKFVPKVIQNLAGASNDRFVGYLLRQVDAAIDGAELVTHTVAGESGREDALEWIGDIEHDGDDARGQLMVELSRALITPIDREDLSRVSRSVDDILDNLRDFLRLWNALEMERSRFIEPIVEAIANALVELHHAIEAMDEDPGQIAPRALIAKKSGNAIRRAFDAQTAALYREPLTIETLKQRDLMRRLDVVGLRFGAAADALSDAAIKRADS